MKLTRLLFQCVKAATDYGDSSFTYQSMITGEALKNPDYSRAVDTSLIYINAFLQRVLTMKRVRTFIKVADASEEDPKIYELNDRAQSVASVFQYCRSGGYNPIAWRTISKGKPYLVRLESPFIASRDVNIQYRKAIPNFDYDQLVSVLETGDDGDKVWTVFVPLKNMTYEFHEAMGTDEKTIFYSKTLQDAVAKAEEEDIELFDDYGVLEESMPLCVDYVKARISDEDPSAGNALDTKTESRILDLDPQETIFSQTKVRRVY